MKKKGWLMVLAVLLSCGAWLLAGPTKVYHELKQEFAATISWAEVVKGRFTQQVLLDVPIENQNDGDALGNGCEITALSMLLRYYGVKTNKNMLAEQLTYQPLTTATGKYGDPRQGFVGDITGGNAAMGVGVEPIQQVALQNVPTGYQVLASRQQLDFEHLIALVAAKTPVWVIATIDFKVPADADFRLWPTDNGDLYVTDQIHAAVVTGFDRQQKIVYINDPYGEKNRGVARATFKKMYEQMDEQALYLQKAA